MLHIANSGESLIRQILIESLTEIVINLISVFTLSSISTLVLCIFLYAFTILFTVCIRHFFFSFSSKILRDFLKGLFNFLFVVLKVFVQGFYFVVDFLYCFREYYLALCVGLLDFQVIFFYRWVILWRYVPYDLDGCIFVVLNELFFIIFLNPVLIC